MPGALMMIAAGRACTPGACTRSQVAAQYMSPGFAVGLAVITLAALPGRAARRAGRRR